MNVRYGPRRVRAIAALLAALMMWAGMPIWTPSSAQAQQATRNSAAPIDPDDGAPRLNSVSEFDRFASGGYVKFLVFTYGDESSGLYFINSVKYHHAKFMQAIGLHQLYDVGEVLEGYIAHDADRAVARPKYGGWHFGIVDEADCSDILVARDLLAESLPFVATPLPLYPTDGKISTKLRECARFGLDVTSDDELGFQAASYSSLNPGVAYGRLGQFGSDDRPGQLDIAVYEALPNDLTIAAGVISTVPQTPLAHVNLRAVAAGIPNAYVRDILSDPMVQNLMGKWVRLEVATHGWNIRPATPSEAASHARKLRTIGDQSELSALDLSVNKITPLNETGFADVGAFGAKAVGVAELRRLGFPPDSVPAGHAIPVSYYQRFMQETGLDQTVVEMLGDESFRAEPGERLADLRRAIRGAITPKWIENELAEMHSAYPPGTSLRYRSSTNAEDLAHLNGAGLYVSKTQHPNEEPVSKSLKQVYAGLWTRRAFDSREFHQLDHTRVAMAVLVHPNYSYEQANGVAVSFDPLSGGDTTGDAYYVNAQVGEDLVTNPDTESIPEELLIDASDCNKVDSIGSSNRTDDGTVLSEVQAAELCRRLGFIHDRWKEQFGLDGQRFAVEIEFKIDSGGNLVIKQARPWVFGPASENTEGQRSTRNTEIVRFRGANRAGTALEIAEALRRQPSTNLESVVLIDGRLSMRIAPLAAWLAAHTGRPLLFAQHGSIDEATAEKLDAWGATADFVGAGAQTLHQALGAGFSDDLIGDDAIETAVLVARAGGPAADLAGRGRTAIIATGRQTYDALAAAPLAAKLGFPILLTERDNVPEPTLRHLRAAEIEHVVIVGGRRAVSQIAEDQLLALASVTRIAGSNRWETAARISSYFRDVAVAAGICPEIGTLHLGLVSGGEPADAAALTPLLAARCGEMLFGGASLGSPTPEWTLSRARQIRWGNDTSLNIAGGVFAVSRTAAHRIAHPF